MTDHCRSRSVRCLSRAIKTVVALVLLLNGGIAAAQTCAPGSLGLSWDAPNAGAGPRIGWDLCWRADNKAGVILSNVFYDSGNNRRLVLREGSLAQLFIAYDDGSSRIDHVTQGGLGAGRFRALTAEDCFGTGATIHSYGARQPLCTREVDRGYLYKYNSAQLQGKMFELFSISDIGEHSFIVRWRFFDDGTMVPAVGSTGRISRYTTSSNHGERVGNRFATSWVSNTFWRLDFDINGAANDAVREFNILRRGANLERQSRIEIPLTREIGRTLNNRVMRSWQIYDKVSTNSEGHSISYHLEPQQGAIRHFSRADAWSVADVYVTRLRPCERYIINNPPQGCAGKTSVRAFLNGENIDGANIVVWYRISRHHMPRDEDLPYRSLEWDSFQVYPRDWTSESPLSLNTPAFKLLNAATGGTA